MTEAQTDEWNKTLEFSGYTWGLKASRHVMGPGPNYFSAHPDSVYVDEAGRLHLLVRKKNQRWLCSEVTTLRPLGYGWYVFYIDSRIDTFDPNIVAGLFTWDRRGEDFRSEVDIEFSTWGRDGGNNGQYVIQPAHINGNLHRFSFQLDDTRSTHCIRWEKDVLEFASYHGHVEMDQILLSETIDVNKKIAEWQYRNADIPQIHDAVVRINLYLFQGKPPMNTQLERSELIVHGFTFIPSKEQ